uniref:MSP domain-containing protein n=1 Tax=Strongyloides venezuelensis TaxID=75913 RepID=A0A0K0FDM9_STRVS
MCSTLLLSIVSNFQSEKFQKLLEKKKTSENELLSDNDIVNVKDKKSKQSSENHKSALDKNNSNTPIEELTSGNLNKNNEKNTSLSKKKVKTGKKIGQKKCETNEIIKETSLKNHINDKCALNETSKFIVKDGNSQDEITKEFVISSNICDNETIMSTIKECVSNEKIIKNLSPTHKTNKGYGDGDISFVKKLSIESEIPSNDIENKEQIEQKISNISSMRIDQSSIKEKGISEESDTRYLKNDPTNLKNQVADLIQTLDETKGGDIETLPLISPKTTKEKIPKTKAKSHKKKVNKTKDVENISINLELTNDNNLIKRLEAVNSISLTRNMNDISYEELDDILIALEKSNDEYVSELTMLDSPKEIHTKNIKKDNKVPSSRCQQEKETTTKTQKKHKKDKNKKAINLSSEIVDDANESHQNEIMKLLNNVDVDVNLIKNHPSEKEEIIFEDRITKGKANQGSLRSVKPTIINKQKDSLIENKESTDDRKTTQEETNYINFEEIPKDSSDSNDKKILNIDSKTIDNKKVMSTRKVKKDSRNNDKKPLEDDYVNPSTCAENEVNVELKIERCTSIDIEKKEIVLPSNAKDSKVHAPIKLTKALSLDDKTDKQTTLQDAKKEITKDTEKISEKKKVESTPKSKDDSLANDNKEIDKNLGKKLQTKTSKKVEIKTKVDISLTSNSKSDCASIVVNNNFNNASNVISVADKKSNKVDNKSTTEKRPKQYSIIKKYNILDNKVISEAQEQETNNKNEYAGINVELERIKVSEFEKEKIHKSKNMKINNELDEIKMLEIKKEKTKDKKGKQSSSLFSNKDFDNTNENPLLDKEETSIDEITESHFDTKQLISTNEEQLQEQTPNFVIKHQEYNLQSGENIVIQQQLTAYPEPNILIKINDNILEQNENIKVIIEREKVDYSINVLVNEIDNTLNGTLSFIASNGLGIDKSFFSINVKDRDQKNKLSHKIEVPKINGPKIKSVKEGDNLKLIYTIKTIEIPEVRIFKNNVYVEDYRFTIDKKHNEYIVSFKIEKLSLSDSGEYICKAINKKGEAMITTMVHVSKKEPYKNEQKIVTNEQVYEVAPKKRKNTPKALQIPREINSLYGEPSKKVSILSVTAKIEADAETTDEAYITLSPREPLSASISIKGPVSSQQANKKETQNYEKDKQKYTIEDLKNETDLVKEKIEVENTKSIKKPKHELKQDELDDDIKVSKKQLSLNEKVPHDSKELKDPVDISMILLDEEKNTKEQKLKDKVNEEYVRHPKKVSALKEKSIDRKSKDEIKKENFKDSVDLSKKVVEVRVKSADEKNKDEFKKDKLKDALDKSTKISEVKQKTIEEKPDDKDKKGKIKDTVDVSKKVSEVKEELTEKKPNDDVKKVPKIKEEPTKEKQTGEKVKNEVKKKKEDSIDLSKKVTEDKEKLIDQKPIFEIMEESVNLSKELIEVKDETELLKPKESSVDFHKGVKKIKEKRKIEKSKDDAKNNSTDISREAIENKKKPNDEINKDVGDISKKITEDEEKLKEEKPKVETKKDSVEIPKKKIEGKEKIKVDKSKDETKKDSVELSNETIQARVKLTEKKPKDKIKNNSIELSKELIKVNEWLTVEKSEEEIKKDSVDLSDKITKVKEKAIEKKPRVEIKKDTVDNSQEVPEVKAKPKTDKPKGEIKKDVVDLSKKVTEAKLKPTEEKNKEEIMKDSVEPSKKNTEIIEKIKGKKPKDESMKNMLEDIVDISKNVSVIEKFSKEELIDEVKEVSYDISEKTIEVKEESKSEKSKEEVKTVSVDSPERITEFKERAIRKKHKNGVKGNRLKEIADHSKIINEVERKSTDETRKIEVKEDSVNLSKNIVEIEGKLEERKPKEDVKIDSFYHLKKLVVFEQKTTVKKFKNEFKKDKLKDSTDVSKVPTKTKDEVKGSFIDLSKKESKAEEKPKSDVKEDNSKDSVDLSMKTTEVKEKTPNMKAKDEVKEDSIGLSKNLNEFKLKKTDKNSIDESNNNPFDLSLELTEAKERTKGLVKKDPTDPSIMIIEVKENLDNEKDENAFRKGSIEISKKVTEVKEKTADKKVKDELKKDSFELYTKETEVKEKIVEKKFVDEFKDNKLKDSSDIFKVVIEVEEKPKEKEKEDSLDLSKKIAKGKGKLTEKKSADENKKDSANLTKKISEVEEKSTEKKSRGEDEKDSLDLSKKIIEVKKKSRSKSPKVDKEKLEDYIDPSKKIALAKEKEAEKESNDEIINDTTDLSKEIPEVKEKPRNKKLIGEVKGDSADLTKNVNEVRLKKTDKISKDEANSNSFGLSMKITEAKERLKGLVKKDPIDHSKMIYEVKENLTDEKDKNEFKKDFVNVSEELNEVKEIIPSKKFKIEVIKDHVDSSKKIIDVKEKLVKEKHEDKFKKDSFDVVEEITEVKSKVVVKKTKSKVKKDNVDHSKTIIEVIEKPTVEKDIDEYKEDSTNDFEKETETKEKIAVEKHRDEYGAKSIDLSEKITEVKEKSTDKKVKGEYNKDSIDVSKETTEVEGITTFKKSKDEVKEDIVEDSKKSIDVKEKTLKKESKNKAKEHVTDPSKKASKVTEKSSNEKSEDAIKKNVIDVSIEVTEAKEKPTEQKNKDKINEDSFELPKEIFEIKEELTMEKLDDELNKDSVNVYKMTPEFIQEPIEEKCIDEIKKDSVDLSEKITKVKRNSIDIFMELTDSKENSTEVKSVEKPMKYKPKDSREPSNKKSKAKDNSIVVKEEVEIMNDKEKIHENITTETKPTSIEDKKRSVYEDKKKEEDSKDTVELSSTITVDSEIKEVLKTKDLEVEADYTKHQLKIAEEIEVDGKFEVEASKCVKIPSDSQYTNVPTYIDDKSIVEDDNMHFNDEVINATFENKVSKDYEEADIIIKKRKQKRGLALKPSSQIHGRRGDTLILECELYHEDDEVSWKFNGSDISDCRMTIENIPYSSKLIIKDVIPSDSNSVVQYTTNDGEKDVSYQSCLKIDEVPIEFIKCLDKKYSGEENNSIELSVELNYMADKANWSVKKDKVIESEKYHLSVVNGEYKFLIDNLDYDDSGLIEFVANDVLCCSTTLEIYGKPYLINKINNGRSITGDIDDKVTHVWNIKSNPEPECEVFFNDNKVKTGIHFNIEVVDNKISLTKQNVSRKDSGEYKLRVFNKYGEDYDTFHILINDVPLPPTSLRLNSIDNDSVTISWSPPETNDDSMIFGYVIEIKETDRRAFKKAGQTNGNKTIFTIENLDINTEYLVRVAAKNKYGISEFTKPIIVKTNSPFEAPIIMTPPTIKSVINNNCELMWEECTDNGGSEIYCYDVFGSENDKEWSKINTSPIFMCNYTVKGLKYSDDDNLVSYKFKVEATNTAGYTSNSNLSSDIITMNKKVSKPKKIINIPKITITSCDSVTVDWICCEPPEDCPSYNIYFKNDDSGTDTWKSVKTQSPPVAINDLKEGISYVFKVCGENDEGEGECSETSKPIKMVSNEAPRFTRALRNVSVAKKSSLQLECHAIGEPLPLFVWCHNNNEIIPDESNDYQILVEGFTTILQVNKISEEHSGEYKCFAINEYGEDDTICTLNVADVRAHFTSTFPEFTSVEEGTTIELTCELSDDDACVTWFKNGKKIDEFATAKYDIIVDGPIRKLRIKEATIFDSCDYSCVTSEGRRSFGEVKVHEKPPYIKIGPQDYTVKSLGETVRLSCTTSSPAKVVKWYKNGKEVWPQSGKIFMNKENCLYYLDIYDFNEKDVGEYNVVIGNEGGDTSASAHVKMLVQPEIQIKSYNGDTELHVGKDLYLQVELQGIPKPKLSVTLNSQDIRSFGGRVEEYDNQAIIKLANLERTHNGILKLIAENDVGVEEKGSILNIIDIPSPPTNLRISDITSNEAKLTWEYPKNDGGCQIEYLLIERKIADNARWRTLHKLKSFKEEYVVEDLCAGEIYAFRIVAVNDVGRSSPSNVVDCVTLEDDSENIPLNETSIVDESLQPPNKPDVQSNGLIVEVSWDEVELVQEYIVERREEEDEIWIELCTTEKCHYQDRSCTSSKKYFYRISSKLENKRSIPSETTEFAFLLPAKVSGGYSLSNNQISKSIGISKNEQELSNKNTNNENEIINIELLEEESKVESIKKKKVMKKEKIKKETKKMKTIGTEELDVFETETSIVVESGFNSKLISYLKSGTSTDCKWYKNDQEKTSDCYVTFDKESVYSIKNASEDDGGTYKCVWYDSSTTVEQTFNVIIKDSEIGLAKIIVPLSDKYVFEDEYETSLQLEIKNVSCNTIMKWYKDDVEIVMNTEKYSCEIENKIVKLSIKNTSINDKGNYMCKIFDGSTEIFSKCNLIVRERRSSDLVIDNTGVPMFHLHLKDTIIKVDESVVLCVTNTTIPEPDDVEWYKDNDRIFPDNEKYFVRKDKGRYILEILKAQITDNGVYKAIGFNKNGRCTSTCQVTVTESTLTSPPEFTVLLMNERVEEKNLVKFEVYLIGSQPLTVKWFKDNVPIIHNDRIRILDDERLRKYSLTILETLKSDAGNYKCIAFNGDGEAETDCILEIQEPRCIPRRVTNELAPSFIFPLPIIREVPELVEMSIVCIVTGEPEPSIKWYKDGKLINKYYETIFNDGVASLIIRLPIVSDSGIYTCEATNSMGAAKCSGIINIKEVNHAAQVPPKFIENLTNVSVIEGNEIILKCQLIGRPTPYVTWYKDGLKLLMTNRIIQYIDRHGNVKLNILEARLDDGGEYTCEAQNLDKKNNLKDFTHCTVNVNESDLTLLSASTALLNRDGRISRASSGIKLKSNQPPLILREPPPLIKLHEGNRELIEVEVDENNDAQIEWLFEGKPLIQSNTLKTYFDGRIAFLKFFQANKSQQGMYKFIASNTFGTTSTEIEVIVESMEFGHDYISEMPSFTKKLEDRVVKLHDKTIFECYVNGTPEINVKWLLNGKTINPSSNILFNSYSQEDVYVHEIELNDITVEETGTLTCVAINKYGECYNSCEIILIKDESDHNINDESNN